MVESGSLLFSAIKVEKAFSSSQIALLNVNALFKWGAIHVVYGPNGAGKSVFLRGLAGLDPFTHSILRRFQEAQLSFSYF